MHTKTDRRLIRAEAQSVRHMVVELVAPRAAPRAARTPVNVAIVLDRSGSMGGGKIELAKTAAAAAVRMLRPEDRFALVVYDNEVDVVVESVHATPEAVRNALDRLATVTSRGSTDLCGGWLRGCEQIASHLDAASVGRCLLLTDGLANHGITDPDEIFGHAAELRRRGVSTSTFGVGEDFNDVFLRQMADEGSGHFYYVESAGQIVDHLTSELGEALEVTARNVRIDVDARDLDGVEVLNAFRTERDGATLRVHLGDLVAGQLMNVALELKFPRGIVGCHVVVNVSAHADGAGFEPSRSSLDWAYASDEENDRQPRDRTVDRVVAELHAHRARLDALRLNRAGDYAGAGNVVEQMANRIRAYAGDDPGLLRIVGELIEARDELGVCMRRSSSLDMYASSSSRSRGRAGSGRAHRS